VSVAANYARQMKWCCLHKLCINSGEGHYPGQMVGTFLLATLCLCANATFSEASPAVGRVGDLAQQTRGAVLPAWGTRAASATSAALSAIGVNLGRAVFARLGVRVLVVAPGGGGATVSTVEGS
jgi:hypothetical protein